MSIPSNDEGWWFQALTGALISLLTLLFGWTQVQINQVKRDATSNDESVRRETLAAIQVLREELTRRLDDAASVQARQHVDNQARNRELQDTINRNAAIATTERQRVIDFMSQMSIRIAQLPDRTEMLAALHASEKKA